MEPPKKTVTNEDRTAPSLPKSSDLQGSCIHARSLTSMPLKPPHRLALYWGGSRIGHCFDGCLLFKSSLFTLHSRYTHWIRHRCTHLGTSPRSPVLRGRVASGGPSLHGNSLLFPFPIALRSCPRVFHNHLYVCSETGIPIGKAMEPPKAPKLEGAPLDFLPNVKFVIFTEPV